jgi:molybdate transport system regulatory protein
MKYGARNNVKAKVTSVLTTESVQELGLNVGDEVQLVIKAIHVLPVKE